jgi:hypothetical protein
MKDGLVLLMRSWKESLLIYIPKNFRLFLLVTIKSAMQTYGYLIYHFWWLFLLLVLVDVGCYYPECLLPGSLWVLFNTLIRGIFVLVIFMLSRPSVPLKNIDYIIEQFMRFGLGFLLLYISFYMFFPWVHMLMTSLILMPIFICALLFYLDSAGSLEDISMSLWRGVKMYLFNLPFFLIAATIVYIVWHNLPVHSIYWKYIFFLFVPFVVSYFKNMYVKRLHDQFNLYYAAQ